MRPGNALAISGETDFVIAPQQRPHQQQDAMPNSAGNVAKMDGITIAKSFSR